MRKARCDHQWLRRHPPVNMSLQTAAFALLLLAWCAAADVSEQLSAPPPDALNADFRQAAGGQTPPPPPPPFPQNAGALRGFPLQQASDLVPTRQVFFRLGNNPPLSDLTARAANEPPLPNPNNFLRGFRNAVPTDPRVQNVANFPAPPESPRSLVNSAPPLALTATFPNPARPQIPMEPRPNGSPSTFSARTSPPQFFNNAPPTQMASRFDAPLPTFPNNVPTTQLLSTSDTPRLPPQPIFRSDTSRLSLPNRAPQTQIGSNIAPLSFPNNAPPFRPNAPLLPLSNGALPTQSFPTAEAPRPSLSNNAPLSQLVSRSGDPRFGPSNSAASPQLFPRPGALSLPQKTAIPNSALCTPENPCRFPDISNEISADNKLPANYQFRYAVQDPLSASDFAHEESAQEAGVSGQYRVLLPDGRQQVVSYRADEGGFRPEISYQ